MVDQVKPSVVEVTIGGIKYSVTPELAKSLETDNKAKQESIEAAKRAAYQPVPKELPANVTRIEKPKYGDRLFESPDEVLNEHGKEIEERVYTRVKSEYQAEKDAEEGKKNLNKFYDDFITENKELSKDRDLVELIFEKNYNNWNKEANGDLTVLKKRLAERATETILRNVKRNDSPDSQQVFESGGMIVQGQPAVAQEETGGSLTQVLKARAEARHKK